LPEGVSTGVKSAEVHVFDWNLHVQKLLIVPKKLFYDTAFEVHPILQSFGCLLVLQRNYICGGVAT